MENKNSRFGAAGSNASDLGSMGALYPILTQLGGGSKAGQMAMDYAQQMYPDAPKADPWEAALQYFLAMGQAASEPGATLLGSGVRAMQAPADYLAAKKTEKRETDRARMQTALQLAPSLKAGVGAAGSSDWVVDGDGNTVRLSNAEIMKRQNAGEKFTPWSKESTTANGLKPFGIIDPSNLTEIQRVIPSASLDADGNILLTDAEAAMAGVRPYIGQKITPSKDPAKEPKISDDGTGTLRYTANPPEGKNIGDIVFEGVDITGFTQNELQLANSLRDDLTKQIEPFRDIRSAFSQIDGFYEEAQSENSPVSDYSLAVQYAKIIDPGTAAREGEVAAIATAGAMSSAFRAALTNALMGTGKLSPRMRASIYNNALRIYGTKLPGALATIERYKTQSNAQKDGLFNLVGLNVDAESYKPVGEGGYQPKDIDSLAEAPEDNSTYNFPPDFNFNSLDRNALLGLLRLPAGSLDDRTLEKIDVALGD
jgi:hypothetical protein